MKKTHTPIYRRWSTVISAAALSTIAFGDPAELPAHSMYDMAPPVQLISFTVTQDQQFVRLDWVTASEWNNVKFVLERSTDGEAFGTIGIVLGAGNSSQMITYKWLDRTPPDGVVQYRLQQIDGDGQSTYSPVATIDMGTGPDPVVSPNPIAADQFTLNNVAIGNQLEIRTMNGALVRFLTATSSTVKYGDLEPGTYLLRITDPETGAVKLTRFVRQ